MPTFRQGLKVWGVVLQEMALGARNEGARPAAISQYLGPVSIVKTGYREWS